MKCSALYLILIGLLLTVSAAAQPEAVKVLRQNEISGFEDEYPCFVKGDELTGLRRESRDLLNETDWSLPRAYRFFQAEMKGTFSGMHNSTEAPLVLPVEGFVRTLGENHYMALAGEQGLWELLVFRPLADGRPGSVPRSIFTSKQAIFNPSPAGDSLNFILSSSNPQGNQDLYLLALGSASPEMIPLEINTDFDEVLPQWHKGDLYFASNRNGHFDLYVAYAAEQWKIAHLLPVPLNSEANDLGICFINERKGFFSSDRAGADSGMDIYYFEWTLNEDEFIQVRGRLAVGDEGIRRARLEVFNALGEFLGEYFTDENGYFEGPELRKGEQYRISSEVSQELLAGSTLYLLDESGNVLQAVSPDAQGQFLFEFLPYDDPRPLAFFANLDETTLFSIALRGQIYKEQPGDVGAGEPLLLLSEDGGVDQLTYTADSGAFAFETVLPLAHYTLKLEDEAGDYQVKMEDSESGKFDEEAEYHYQRLKKGEFMRLQLSDSVWIEVDPGEALELATIHYEFDQFELGEQGKRVLDQLAKLLIRNPGVQLEMHAHTDSRGSENYNLNLSEKRVQGAVAYLQSRGVPAASLSGKGFGESRILNHCRDEVDCSEEEHSRNRRTEVILRMKR